jgi:ribonuclease-3
MHATNLPSRIEVENLLGFEVRRLELYQEALIHKSAVKYLNVPQSNERLEFMGDSVINMVIAKYLYTKYPNENEGFLTKVRTRIVSGKCLSKIAHKMNIHVCIRMNTKALQQGWNTNTRIMEDAYEAIIGAIYLDLGFAQAKQFILNRLHEYVNTDDILKDTNYKDMIMRYTQSKAYILPEYKIIQEYGMNHNKKFHIGIYIESNLLGTGVEKCKKDAEQQAAYNSLKCLGLC